MRLIPACFRRGVAADVFVQDARDQALIRKSFLRGALFEHLEVGARVADAGILPQVTPGCLHCGLLRRLLVLHGPEFAALIGGDQVPFRIIMKSAPFHAGSPFLLTDFTNKDISEEYAGV
jgi:hypothetical protein